MVFIFLLILGVLALIDHDVLLIPNAIVLPGLVFGVLVTKSYLPVLFFFVIGSLLYTHGRLGGGDVKLLSMGAAFFGWLALPVYLVSMLIVFVYRAVKGNKDSLAFAPFYFLSSILVIATHRLVKWLTV